MSDAALREAQEARYAALLERRAAKIAEQKAAGLSCDFCAAHWPESPIHEGIGVCDVCGEEAPIVVHNANAPIPVSYGHCHPCTESGAVPLEALFISERISPRAGWIPIVRERTLTRLSMTAEEYAIEQDKFDG